ncbi:MAG: sigma-54-dependent Fis family transcriptional regulator [Phycisphaerales bacterium]|nr:sigma-54-dependent Fis family transcriptional regulator [Phycisphaerales bacterium]
MLIVVLEDDSTLRNSLIGGLELDGHEALGTDSVRQARDYTLKRPVDAIICDVHLVGESGLDLVRELRADGFGGVILVVTAFGTIDLAVEAMRNGADDFLQKPVKLAELDVILQRALESRGIRRRLEIYERLERASAAEPIGESRAWLESLTLARRYAALPIPTGDGSGDHELPTILLLGETGAGKGVLARRIHTRASELGHDPGLPFVHVNCSALPPALVESELFGHERGAFTDAKAARPGLFEMADRGTIFLDEIGDMPLDLQARLLLVVEQGTFRRVGGTRDRSVRTRVIAATNQDLEARVESGDFRRDLFYRLNAFTIHIPPLRERTSDILVIAEAMLKRFCHEYRRPGMTFSIQATAALKHHAWPGNVRELINAVQRAVMLSERDEITPTDLGLSATATRKIAAPRSATVIPDTAGGRTPIHFDFENWSYSAEDVERELIVQALQRVKGNVSKAAKLIGMNRSSLRYRIERGGLEEYVKEIARQ